MRNSHCSSWSQGVVMKGLQSFILSILTFFVVDTAVAWNLGAKEVDVVRVEKSGKVSFTLRELGDGNQVFSCEADTSWFYISPCSSDDPVCVAAVDRMASTLVAARLAGEPVSVERANCAVTEVALRD